MGRKKKKGKRREKKPKGLKKPSKRSQLSNLHKEIEGLFEKKSYKEIIGKIKITKEESGIKLNRIKITKSDNAGVVKLKNQILFLVGAANYFNNGSFDEIIECFDLVEEDFSPIGKKEIDLFYEIKFYLSAEQCYNEAFKCYRKAFTESAVLEGPMSNNEIINFFISSIEFFEKAINKKTKKSKYKYYDSLVTAGIDFLEFLKKCPNVKNDKIESAIGKLKKHTEEFKVKNKENSESYCLMALLDSFLGENTALIKKNFEEAIKLSEERKLKQNIYKYHFAIFLYKQGKTKKAFELFEKIKNEKTLSRKIKSFFKDLVQDEVLSLEEENSFIEEEDIKKYTRNIIKGCENLLLLYSNSAKFEDIEFFYRALATYYVKSDEEYKISDHYFKRALEESKNPKIQSSAALALAKFYFNKPNSGDLIDYLSELSKDEEVKKALIEGIRKEWASIYIQIIKTLPKNSAKEVVLLKKEEYLRNYHFFCLQHEGIGTFKEKIEVCSKALELCKELNKDTGEIEFWTEKIGLYKKHYEIEVYNNFGSKRYNEAKKLLNEPGFDQEEVRNNFSLSYQSYEKTLKICNGLKIFKIEYHYRYIKSFIEYVNVLKNDTEKEKATSGFLKYIDSLIKKEEKDHKLYNFRAVALLIEDKKDSLILEAYKKAIELSSSDPESQSLYIGNLTHFFCAKKIKKENINNYFKSFNFSEKEELRSCVLGVILYKEGKEKEALKLFQKIKEKEQRQNQIIEFFKDIIKENNSSMKKMTDSREKKKLASKNIARCYYIINLFLSNYKAVEYFYKEAISNCCEAEKELKFFKFCFKKVVTNTKKQKTRNFAFDKIARFYFSLEKFDELINYVDDLKEDQLGTLNKEVRKNRIRRIWVKMFEEKLLSLPDGISKEKVELYEKYYNYSTGRLNEEYENNIIICSKLKDFYSSDPKVRDAEKIKQWNRKLLYWKKIKKQNEKVAFTKNSLIDGNGYCRPNYSKYFSGETNEL